MTASLERVGDLRQTERQCLGWLGDPGEAQSTLALVEQSDKWTGAASSVFSHLRKRAPEAASAIAAARDLKAGRIWRQEVEEGRQARRAARR